MNDAAERLKWLNNAGIAVYNANMGALRIPLFNAIAGCNQGNACPWTEIEDQNGKTHCKACGLQSCGQGSSQ